MGIALKNLVCWGLMESISQANGTASLLTGFSNWYIVL